MSSGIRFGGLQSAKILGKGLQGAQGVQLPRIAKDESGIFPMRLHCRVSKLPKNESKIASGLTGIKASVQYPTPKTRNPSSQQPTRPIPNSL
jgi:hypothetical protein